MNKKSVVLILILMLTSSCSSFILRTENCLTRTSDTCIGTPYIGVLTDVNLVSGKNTYGGDASSSGYKALYVICGIVFFPVDIVFDTLLIPFDLAHMAISE